MPTEHTQGDPFCIQLGQYRDHLLHLKTRWSNPLASSIRFDSHVAEASLIASRLTGRLEPAFKWTYVTNVCEAGTDADDQDQQDANLSHHEILTRDEEEEAIMVSEIFEDESDDDEDPSLRNPPVQGILDEDNIVVVEVSQTEKAESKDGTVMGYSKAAMSFCWIPPVRFDSIVTINNIIYRLFRTLKRMSLCFGSSTEQKHCILVTITGTTLDLELLI